MSVLHRASYYVQPGGTPCHQWLVDHYAEAVASDPSYFDALKDLKPSFVAYAYNSGTDDYTFNADGTPAAEGLRVKAAADALGVPLETMYLHWAEDTVVSFWLTGDPGPTPCFYPAGSRIEMYRAAHQSGGRTRQLCSFIPAARPVQTKAMLEVAQVKSPKGRQWDGLFLDNCGNILYNWGDPLISGGTVLECGFKIGPGAFSSWYWLNLRDWLVEFRVAMRALGPPRLVDINVANSWTDEFCTHPVCDRIGQEFVGNPIRDTWPSVLEMGRRHQLAEANSIGMWASANPALGSPQETYQEMQYAALCLHLAVAQPLSSTHIQNGNGPTGPNWPQLVVSPVEANHQFQLLGNPTGDCCPWEGSPRGPSTRQQHLWFRPYDRGGVWVRNLEPWNGLTTETWDIPRGPQMIWLKPDGTNETHVATVPIKNGGGAIFVRA